MEVVLCRRGVGAGRGCGSEADAGDGMKRQEVVDLYDEAYATSYDERFLLNDCQVRSDHELEIVSRLLVPGEPWLDVACGTGYVLSRFPGVPRAGLDLAPAMLKQAGEANPDALFLREAD